MKQVSIYLQNAHLTPSSYYRLTQYFLGSGARLHSALPNGVYTWWHSKNGKGKLLMKVFLYLFYVVRTLVSLFHDVMTLHGGTVIISKVVVPHHLPLLHRCLIKILSRRNQLIWDFDDNMLETRTISKADFNFMARTSHKIVVTNSFLMSLVEPCYQEKVTLLPTTDGDMLTLDAAMILAHRKALFEQEIRLVWVATANGLAYLSAIISDLEVTARAIRKEWGKRLCLHVVCNKPLEMVSEDLEIVNIPWDREKAKEELGEAHIGLMPLPDTPFTRGKGAFKLIQYLSASMPVVASQVGFNKEVVTKEVGHLIQEGNTTFSWKEAIMDLAKDWDSYIKRCEKAKAHYDQHYSFEGNKSFWMKMVQSPTKLYMVVNEDRFFLSHRKDIAIEAVKNGYEVCIICKDTGRKQEVLDLGLPMIELPINPTGSNIFEELKTFRFLLKLYRKDRPDIVHHVGIKNILWGGLAARLTRIKGVVNAVSGLGVLFSGEHFGLMTRCVMMVMRFSSNRENVKQIFQNSEDRELFVKHGIAKDEQCEFIKGSGVDLTKFVYTPEPDTQPIKVILTARMVKEKGICTLIEAAEMLRSEMEGKVQFLLCGCLSNNPEGIQEEELRQWCDGSYIQWLGHRNDIMELLMASHIVVLPSYYREGVPRSLIEACAIGRPIVTTLSIGCKDTVDDGKNGFLIMPKDAKSLADKLITLINNPQLRKEMGLQGRKKAEEEFSVVQVVKKHMEIYAQLIAKK